MVYLSMFMFLRFDSERLKQQMCQRVEACDKLSIGGYVEETIKKRGGELAELSSSNYLRLLELPLTG